MVARDGIEPPTPAFSVLIGTYLFDNTREFTMKDSKTDSAGLHFMPDKQA